MTTVGSLPYRFVLEVEFLIAARLLPGNFTEFGRVKVTEQQRVRCVTNQVAIVAKYLNVIDLVTVE